MNIELLDPFEQDFPEVIEERLEDGPAVVLKFNRRGTLLAAGCSDGTIVVWDFDTRGVSRLLIGHVKTVTSLSWSRNGRLLLSASRDWSCICWDLLTGTKKHTIRFDTPVLNAQFHPKNNALFIAALYQETAVMVDFSNGNIRQYPIPFDINTEGDGAGSGLSTVATKSSAAAPSSTTSSPAATPSSTSSSTHAATTTGPASWTLVVTFDRQGNKIYAGTNRGYLIVIDAETRKVVSESRPTTSSIKHIQFSRRGTEMVINSNDRIIRLFSLPERSTNSNPVMIHRFQDLVNRNQWNQCCMSNNMEYVIGGSAAQAEHNIYIWDKIGGNLVKILEGPKEPLEDLAWHPIRPIVASVSNFGTIHIWATNYQENWSAFAPDFKELEENIEYEERENEFDIEPEEEASKRKNDDEDLELDVTTIEKINRYNDSDLEGDLDEEEETFYLPLLPQDHQDDESLAALAEEEDMLREGHRHHHRHRNERLDREHGLGHRQGQGIDDHRTVSSSKRHKSGREIARRDDEDLNSEREGRSQQQRRKQRQPDESISPKDEKPSFGGTSNKRNGHNNGNSTPGQNSDREAKPLTPKRESESGNNSSGGSHHHRGNTNNNNNNNPSRGSTSNNNNNNNSKARVPSSLKKQIKSDDDDLDDEDEEMASASDRNHSAPPTVRPIKKRINSHLSNTGHKRRIVNDEDDMDDIPKIVPASSSSVPTPSGSRSGHHGHHRTEKEPKVSSSSGIKKDRDREKDRDHRERDRDRGGDRPDHDKDRERDRGRDRNHDHGGRDRDRSKSRERSHAIDSGASTAARRDNTTEDGSRDHRPKHSVLDQEREKAREKDRDQRDKNRDREKDREHRRESGGVHGSPGGGTAKKIFRKNPAATAAAGGEGGGDEDSVSLKQPRKKQR